MALTVWIFVMCVCFWLLAFGGMASISTECGSVKTPSITAAPGTTHLRIQGTSLNVKPAEVSISQTRNRSPVCSRRRAFQL